MQNGKFFGIGVGPGDSELMTLKAYRVLQQVDIICTPKSKMEKDSLAFSIVRQEIAKEFETMELLFPMSSDLAILEEHWDKAADQILAKLKEGKTVAFVTIGDPMFYSTYAYVLKRLKHLPDLQTETIPGITAFSASINFLNCPLTEGDDKLAVIPAVYDANAIADVLRNFEAVVLMKVNKVFDQVVDVLEEQNLLDKAVFISRCGYPDQFYTKDIKSLVGKKQDYMSLMIIKKSGWEGLQ